MEIERNKRERNLRAGGYIKGFHQANPMPPSLTRHPSIVDSSPWRRKRRIYLGKSSPPVLLTVDQDSGASLFVLSCAPHMDKRENLSSKQDCTSFCFLFTFLF
jgi:hypothetical protein